MGAVTVLVVAEMCSGIEEPSRLMWVRVKIEQTSLVFISAYGPSSDKCETLEG